MARARLKSASIRQWPGHAQKQTTQNHIKPNVGATNKPMKLSNLKNSGHWPTLLTAFLYFDFSFMVWTVLGPLGAQIGESLHLSPEQKGLMVALPILSGAILRIALGMLVDRIGAKNTGVIAQLVVIAGLALGW